MARKSVTCGAQRGVVDKPDIDLVLAEQVRELPPLLEVDLTDFTAVLLEESRQ